MELREGRIYSQVVQIDHDRHMSIAIDWTTGISVLTLVETGPGSYCDRMDTVLHFDIQRSF